MIFPQVKPNDWKTNQSNWNRLSLIFTGTQNDPSISALVITSAAITNLTVSNFTGETIGVVSAQVSGASIDNLSATSIVAIGASISNAVIDSLAVISATISSLVAVSATISSLVADNATINSLVATEANVSSLVADNATISSLVATSATLSALVVTSADIATLAGTTAIYSEMGAGVVSADTAVVGVASVDTLTANSATVSVLVVTSAVFSALQSGNATDYVSITSSGVRLVGGAVVYDDQQVNISTVKLPASGAPTWTAWKGSQVLAFSPSADNKIYFTAQLSHKYKLASPLEFHIHTVYPVNSTGAAVWNFTHSWADINQEFPAESTVTAVITSPETVDHHTYQEVAGSIPATTVAGNDVSSIVLCSLEREGSAIDDTYGSNIYLTALDFHIAMDDIGSDEETSK